MLNEEIKSPVLASPPGFVDEIIKITVSDILGSTTDPEHIRTIYQQLFMK